MTISFSFLFHISIYIIDIVCQFHCLIDPFVAYFLFFPFASFCLFLSLFSFFAFSTLPFHFNFSYSTNLTPRKQYYFDSYEIEKYPKQLQCYLFFLQISKNGTTFHFLPSTQHFQHVIFSNPSRSQHHPIFRSSTLPTQLLMVFIMYLHII